MSAFSISVFRARAHLLFPGVLVAVTVAAAAKFLAGHYGAPVMLFALLIGMAFNFLAEDVRCQAGIEFASKTLLRAGVVLLGARITMGEIASIGVSGFLTVIGLIALTIGCGFVCAKLFNRGWRFAILTGGSVAICGASAALAIASVIPHNDKTERNVLFTVVSVTTLSTIAMITYPIVFSLAGLTDDQNGFLIGATIHDVAQVVGAGYSVSTDAGDLATIVKLLRVAMLPVVLLIIVLSITGANAGKGNVGVPMFVVGFVALTTVNSFGVISAAVISVAVDLSSWLLLIAISALGVKTNLKAILALGWRHVAVVVAETLFLLAMALAALSSGLLV